MTRLNAMSLQMLENKIKLCPPVLPASLAEHCQNLKRCGFICSYKDISDNITYRKVAIAQFEKRPIKKFKSNLDFLPSAKFCIVHLQLRIHVNIALRF